MKRRHFIMSASATFAIAPLPVLAASALDYQDGLVDQRLAAFRLFDLLRPEALSGIYSCTVHGVDVRAAGIRPPGC